MTIVRTFEDVRDRVNISDTLCRYCSTVDQKDFVGLRAVFAEDARMRFCLGGTWNEWVEGADAIVAWIDKMTADHGFQHHLLSVYHVDIEGDQASTLAYLTSHQVAAGDPDQVMQMSSRYRNRLRRDGDGWVITQIELEVGWIEIRAFDQSQAIG
ncbi:nuclear transport factor 2 family protein [Frankia sp. Cj5]|uniref:nuclear transport factor 2 family protein n=1 Tax=Frankia sp. Cj5 TaxID=2880978 RepID=UPI001EF72D7F|nr:nuclear transport factor 2 family protein [Frankia sp. Cj5]